MMSEEIHVSGDVNVIKSPLMNKIENINMRISCKREQDMHRLKEKTLEDMSSRLSEIKEEADEIRRRSQEIEFESMRDALTGLHNRKGYDEKLSETIAHVNRYNIKSSVIIFSISIGLSEFRKVDDSNTVFERADKALYLAKASGKNMVKTDAESENRKNCLK